MSAIRWNRALHKSFYGTLWSKLTIPVVTEYSNRSVPRSASMLLYSTGSIDGNCLEPLQKVLSVRTKKLSPYKNRNSSFYICMADCMVRFLSPDCHPQYPEYCYWATKSPVCQYSNAQHHVLWCVVPCTRLLEVWHTLSTRGKLSQVTENCIHIFQRKVWT